MPIHFFNEDLVFQPENQTTLITWLHQVFQLHDKQIIELNYIFCSDEYLLSINQKHLQHDYYTDIITFDNSEEESAIEGDIFISVERVRENASSLNHSFDIELYRVLAHGLLHLIGFNDKTDSEKKVMREKEDACISLLQNLSST